MAADTDLDIRELEELDFEVIEEHDFATPCDAQACDVTAVWGRIATCVTEGCPDQTFLLCGPHGEFLRRIDAEAKLGNKRITCNWCGTDKIETLWRRL